MDFEFEEKDGKITITRYKRNLGNVVIPSEIDGKPVVCIKDGAFISKPHMLEVTIPDSVTVIEARAFPDESESPFFTHIHVDSGNTMYKDIDGVLFSKDGKVLIKYMAARKADEYSIPGSVVSIEV
ncbi:MAG: hypothetical protein LBT55_00010 [Clostridiaceae bacterium]|jgi:hypothetical protein|nr:hypothetical protein [Clostridiaceae bacterium]